MPALPATQRPISGSRDLREAKADEIRPERYQGPVPAHLQPAQERAAARARRPEVCIPEDPAYARRGAEARWQKERARREREAQIQDPVVAVLEGALHRLRTSTAWAELERAERAARKAMADSPSIPRRFRSPG